MRHALRNIRRLKMRSLLTFAIAFSILMMSMLGYFIRTLCEENRMRFYGPLDGSVFVTDEDMQPYLTYEAAEILCGDADVISKISARREYVGVFSELAYVGKDLFTRDRYPGEPIPIGESATYIKGFQVVGVTAMDILNEVYSSDLTILEGTMITEENNEKHHNKIVISKELAEQNNLAIGDAVILDMVSLYRDEQEMIGYEKSSAKDSYVYTIGGIYQHRMDNSGGVSEPWRLNANHVYVPITTLVDISNSQRVQSLYHVTYANGLKIDPSVVPDSLYFHLTDMSVLKGLEEEINTIGFSKNILLTEYVSDAASSPSARLSEVISIVLIGVITVGMVIFLLAIFFHMKARHRELAMLVALGQNRGLTAFSFFTEILILVSFSIIIGVGLMVGTISIFEKPFTEYLYSAELFAQFYNERASDLLFGGSMGTAIMNGVNGTKNLITAYLAPSFTFALIESVILLIVCYLFITVYISKINALSGVGGKE